MLLNLCTNNTDDSASKVSTLPTCETTQNPPTSNSNPPQDTPSVASLTISTTTSLQSIHLTNEPVCLLKTAVATVAHERTKIDANVLFDEGSQHSFEAPMLIDKLQLQPQQMESVQLSTFGATNPQVKKLNVASLQMITKSGILILFHSHTLVEHSGNVQAGQSTSPQRTSVSTPRNQI